MSNFMAFNCFFVIIILSKRFFQRPYLGKFFYDIALKRCNELKDPVQKDLFVENKNESKFKILNIDCRKATKKLFPKIDYMITSPPYWDMLNMKGAENQAKRREKDLKLSI